MTEVDRILIRHTGKMGTHLDVVKRELADAGVVIKVKCPDCEWSQFVESYESRGMEFCLSCNSTGYLIKPLLEEKEGL